MTAVAQLAVGAGTLAALTLFKTMNPGKRKIDTLTAHTVIRETHNDQAVITDHPVEYGSPISDHMYVLPKRVDIEIVYSLSSGINGFKAIASLAKKGGKAPKTLTDYYQAFLDIQTKSKLINIVTGKRVYNNMVIESIECTTDVDSEELLRLQLRCREVIIVYTSTTEAGNKNQASPKDTASAQQKNQVQANPASSSLGANFQTYAVTTLNPLPAATPI